MDLDLEKLKLLANNENDFLEAYKKKIIQYASAHGHEMSFFVDHGSMVILGYCEYISYCKKCPLQVSLEVVGTHNGNKFYYHGDNVNTKCSGYIK